MYQNLYTLSIYLASKMYQGLSNFSTMLPGVFVNVRYKCGYVHLFPHMTALHTVSYAQHFYFYNYYIVTQCISLENK